MLDIARQKTSNPCFCFTKHLTQALMYSSYKDTLTIEIQVLKIIHDLYLFT